MSSNVGGSNPSKYLGVKALNPPEVVILKRAPTTSDTKHAISTIWIDETNDDVYIFTSASAGSANWTLIGISSSPINDVAHGGTGLATITDNGLMVGSGTNAVTPLAVGTNGQLLVGSTGADPVFATAGSANTSIASTLGAGTLNLDIDESYLQTIKVTIATADVLALATTPIELVASPGADKIIEFLGAKFILNYGTIAYTEAGDNLGIKYTDAAGVQVSQNIEMTGFIDQVVDMVTTAGPSIDAIVTAAGCVNQALVLDNLNANFAAGDSPLDVHIRYRIITAAL